jgi:hypothetical protein
MFGKCNKEGEILNEFTVQYIILLQPLFLILINISTCFEELDKKIAFDVETWWALSAPFLYCWLNILRNFSALHNHILRHSKKCN